MPRLKQVNLSLIPICKLIEANMDMQASALFQAMSLEGFEKLKAEKQTLRMRLKEILQKLEELDELQNEIFNDVLYHANRIYGVAHSVNGLLKRFDVGSEGREKDGLPRVSPLFG